MKEITKDVLQGFHQPMRPIKKLRSSIRLAKTDMAELSYVPQRGLN